MRPAPPLDLSTGKTIYDDIEKVNKIHDRCMKRLYSEKKEDMSAVADRTVLYNMV